MSRCLPFPPQGYLWNGVSGEALLELIKVQRERVKAEREKKKEKRRRKKQKKKERKQGEIWVKKRGHHKRNKRLRSNEGEGIRSENHGKSEYETQEIMDRSSLTEELDEQPISDSLYESSDSSQSIPRKRNSRSCYEFHNHGSLVQIDFQLQKHKTPPEGLSSKPDCSIRLMDSVAQKKLELPVEEQFSSASDVPATDDVQEFIPPCLEEHCHSFQRARLDMDEKSEMTQIESKFRKLVVNWIPPPLLIEHVDVDDQDWLFETNPTRSDILETTNVSKDVLHHGNSMSCPYDLFLLHSSTMMDLEVQKKLESDAAPVKEHISSITDAQELATPPLKLLCHSSSQGVGVDTDDKSKIDPSPTTPSESQFRESMLNRLPPSLQLEPFDQEWLFKTKQPRRSDIRDTSIVHQGNFTQYPYAQYLPQTNIYALPYTILH